jgi:hypothetical protein
MLGTAPATRVLRRAWRRGGSRLGYALRPIGFTMLLSSYSVVPKQVRRELPIRAKYFWPRSSYRLDSLVKLGITRAYLPQFVQIRHPIAAQLRILVNDCFVVVGGVSVTQWRTALSSASRRNGTDAWRSCPGV